MESDIRGLPSFEASQEVVEEAVRIKMKLENLI
jgi:hypothetical protein